MFFDCSQPVFSTRFNGQRCDGKRNRNCTRRTRNIIVWKRERLNRIRSTTYLRCETDGFALARRRVRRRPLRHTQRTGRTPEQQVRRGSRGETNVLTSI
jgi:hypothetical protein